jgi:hypothetical protein
VAGEGADRRLVGYVVAAGAPPHQRSLRAWLADRLPGYMVPEVLVPVDDLPVGPTGKVARDRLPRADRQRPPLTHAFVAASTDTQRRVAAVWGAALELDRVGIHDNFFDLGGNSIRALIVLERLRSWSPEPLTLVDLFRYTTVAALADRLEQRAAPDDLTDAHRRGARRAAALARVRGARQPTTTRRSM